MAKAVVLITTTWLRAEDDASAALVSAGMEVRYAPGGVVAPSQLSDVDALIAGTEPIDEPMMEAAPRLKVISRTGVGYDNVDLAAATRRGIAVCATPGVNRRSVAEFSLALILNVARQIPANAQALREGRWTQPSGIELAGKTIGIVGFGAVGRDVARLCISFGMRVLASDPLVDAATFAEHGAEKRDLDSLLVNSDIVTLHLALTDETHHLIDADAIAKMKNTAYLINAARGGIVDETALLAALEEKRLAGAALDTFAEEPLPHSSPLHRAPNLLATSHIGGATLEGRYRSGVMAAESVIRALTGELPEAAVNKDAISTEARSIR